MNKDLTPEEIAHSCEEAAALLEGRWVRGAWEQNGSYCVEGALAAALGYSIEEVADGTQEGFGARRSLRSCQVYQAVTDTLVARLAKDPDMSEGNLDRVAMELEDAGLPFWNDQDGRTEQDVLDLLHATAKRVQGVEE